MQGGTNPVDDDVREVIRRLALYNALQYGGQARAGAVLGKVLAERPDLKGDLAAVLPVVHAVVKDVNQLAPERQRQILAEQWPSLLEEKRVQPEEKRLPPLPNAEKYPLIHLRFCPNPDGALHLGGCRAAVLDDEYAQQYHGRLTLRFDDTDPRTKSPIREAYDWIRADLDWLGVTWHQEVYQSDRLELYYAYARRLLDAASAYVCTCHSRRFRSLTLARTACPCRDLPPEAQLDRWHRMLDGRYREGDAVVRIKTDLNHPNPAVREWPALRIIDVAKYPHPRMGDRYRVWPLFAFCCAIDDHDLAISHILRGKEHLTNSERGSYLYAYLGWSPQEAIHYGRLQILGSVLSKSKIRQGIQEGTYTGWDDPRLGTLQALRRRGFLPETIRAFITELGPKPVDVKVSWSNLEAINRKRLDPVANRFFFVANPVTLRITGVDDVRVAEIRCHPDDPARGSRVFTVTPRHQQVTLLVSQRDQPFFQTDAVIRLMELFNIQVTASHDGLKAKYHSETYQEAKALEAPLIHWLPAATGVTATVTMADATVVEGVAEDHCKTLTPGDVVQFERFGFARIDAVDGHLAAYFTHR